MSVADAERAVAANGLSADVSKCQLSLVLLGSSSQQRSKSKSTAFYGCPVSWTKTTKTPRKVRRAETFRFRSRQTDPETNPSKHEIFRVTRQRRTEMDA